MKKIEWDISLETGIAEIDIQHRIIFNLVKILMDALDTKREGEVIEAIIEELSMYAKYHFSSEEKYYIADKENIEEHKKVHKYFIKKVSGFSKLYKEMNNREFSEFILNFLVSWITDHIKGLDMRDLPKK